MDLKQIFFYLVLITFAPACKHAPAEESEQLKQARVIQKEALETYNALVLSVDGIQDSILRSDIKLKLDDLKKGMVELPHNHDHDHDHDHDHEHHESNLTDQQMLDAQTSWKAALEGIKASMTTNTNN